MASERKQARGHGTETLRRCEAGEPREALSEHVRRLFLRAKRSSADLEVRHVCMSAFLAAFSPPPGPYALRCGCDVNCPYSPADIEQYVLSRNGRLALDSVLLNCQRKHILLRLVSGWSALCAAVYAQGPTVYPGAMAILTGRDHNGMRTNANVNGMPSYVKRMSVHSVVCVPRPTAHWPYSTLMLLTSNLHLSMCSLEPRHRCWIEYIRCRREAVLCVQVHSRVHSRGCRVDPPKTPTYNETSEAQQSITPTHSLEYLSSISLWLSILFNSVVPLQV